MNSLKFLFILHLFVWTVEGEIFSALTHITALLETKSEILALLDNLINKEEAKLQYIKQFRTDYNELTEATTPEEKVLYLSNPIHSFLLIKKLTSDWLTLSHVLLSNFEAESMSKLTSKKESTTHPTVDDLEGAALGLIRIQEVYELQAKEIADGAIPGIKNSKKLTANDCFEIGRQAFTAEYYMPMIEWLNEAISRVKLENPPTIETTDVLETLAYGYFKIEDYAKALNYTLEIIEIMPSHPRAFLNKVHYEGLITALKNDDKSNNKMHEDKTTKPSISNGVNDLNKESENDFNVVMQSKKNVTTNQTDNTLHSLMGDDISGINIRAQYKYLCRNDIDMISPQTSLECRYVDENPFLKIQPLKLEEKCLSPFLAVIYDLVSDNEIEYLKMKANPWLSRALVWNETHNFSEVSRNRTSKFAWLSHEDPVAYKITKRISALTKLTMTYVEYLQIANYGIGGHYDPHYDFLSRTSEEAQQKFQSMGNRIATALIYMSDVEIGGATVFPLLGVKINPKKGSAAFWFNLLRNGEPDYRTEHGGCPVVKGSKWVSNQWFHEKDQEFTYPCTLDKDI